MSGRRSAEKGDPPLHKEHARWRDVEDERNLDEEAPDVDRKGNEGLTKNPGGAGTQGTREKRDERGGEE